MIRKDIGMMKFALLGCWIVVFVGATSLLAGEAPHYVDGHNSVIHGGNLEMSQAVSRDTVFLIRGGPYTSQPRTRTG